MKVLPLKRKPIKEGLQNRKHVDDHCNTVLERAKAASPRALTPAFAAQGKV